MFSVAMFAPFAGLETTDFDRIISDALRTAYAPESSADYPEPPKVGDRIRLRREVNKYPHFIAERGATGTVVESAADEICGLIVVKMDAHLPGAEDWDNCVYWTADDDEALDSGREPYAAVPFWADCARIVDLSEV